MLDFVVFAVGLPLIAELVDRALPRVGQSKKELAADLGYSQPCLSRVLSGERPLNIETLRRLHPRVLQALGAALIELAGGEPPLTLSALRAELDSRIPHSVFALRLAHAHAARKEGAA